MHECTCVGDAGRREKRGRREQRGGEEGGGKGEGEKREGIKGGSREGWRCYMYV